MTLEEYRIRHSMLIEQYQWIEFDLEGLYAALSDDSFIEAIREIERDSIGGVVREIRRIERDKDITVFSDEEYRELDALRERRNFWSHVCYTEAYDRKTGVPRNAKLLSADQQRAAIFLEHLREIKGIYMEKKRR